MLEEEKIPVLKEQVRKAIEDIATLKEELVSAGEKTRKLILEQKKKFEKECPEEALAVEKILTLKKELDVLLFSKEFKKLVEQANLMIDSRSFKKFRESFDELVKLPDTSPNVSSYSDVIIDILMVVSSIFLLWELRIRMNLKNIGNSL